MNVSRRHFLKLASGLIVLAAGCGGGGGGDKGGDGDTGKRYNKIPILLYHDISDLYDDDSTIPSNIFEEQMDWLYDNGYGAISLRDLTAETYTKKPVVITFDDGWGSFIPHAFPIFQNYGFKSNINIIGDPDWIGSIQVNYGGDPRPTLGWSDYIDLKNSGIVDFGSHTYKMHVPAFKTPLGVAGVPGFPDGDFELDIDYFNTALYNNLGITTDIFAWPYGSGADDPDLVDIAKSYGPYKYILSSSEEVYDKNVHTLNKIPRINIDQRFYDINDFSDLFVD
jgi:peptidoglycan/xylan/chitin deacetylase (PgdA/CDA1 family)